MKKVLFCLSLIFGLLVLNQVPSFGMEFTIDLPTIGGLGDLGYGLLGGASFDFTDSDYVIEDFDSLSEALKEQVAEEKARKFLIAYCFSRGIPIPNIDPDLPAVTGKEFYKSQYFDSVNRTVWNNYKLGRTTIEQQDALRFPINPQSFNDWAGYSSFWYQKYIQQFENDEITIVDPPIGYIDYVNQANNIQNNGFFWKELPKHWDNGWWYNDVLINDNFEDHSYFAWFGYDYYNVSSEGKITGNYQASYFHTGVFVAPNVLNLEITGNQNTGYSGIIQNISYIPNVFKYHQSVYPDAYSNSFYIESSGNMYGVGLNGLEEDVSNFVNYCSYDASSLSDVLNYFTQRFKNINIIVNDEMWSAIVIPNDNVIPDFNDVIRIGDDDTPAYDIVFPDTPDNEGTFDITSLFDAIKEAIIGASDSDTTTDGTLTRDKVTDTFKDKVGEAVGEAAKTIDDVLDDSFPVEGTLNYPNLPPIPIIPLDNAFAGTTILSELIDACQQILPSPLALAFWGMIFILFIIGLIRILHK